MCIKDREVDKMILCDYGCGQKAKYQFKNGKWCCSKNVSSCLAISKKKSKSATGNKQSIETIKKIKKTTTGKKKSIEHRKNISIGRKHIKFTKKHKNNISKSHIGKRISIEQIKEKYPLFTKIEEMRYNPDKPKEKEIQVHCKNHNCKNSKEKDGWFTPTGRQIEQRKYSIEKNNFDGTYFYCSKECKDNCPLYGKRVSTLIREDQIRAGYIEDPWYTSSEYYTWRDKVFELDNNLCIYCGQPATIAHHILPQKTHPESALDSVNGLSVCQECHFKYGHREPWCTTGKLSTLVCKRIVKIKGKNNDKNCNHCPQ